MHHQVLQQRHMPYSSLPNLPATHNPGLVMRTILGQFKLNTPSSKIPNQASIPNKGFDLCLVCFMFLELMEKLVVQLVTEFIIEALE